ncbi:MAG: FecR family protein [Pseudomonadota bacterium]
MRLAWSARLSVFVSAVVLGLSPASAEIGSVSAVNSDMDGTPPEQSRRPLALGTQVVRNERIQTSAAGSGQLIFLDQTALSVAPQTDLILDTYIYDPAATTGEIALTLTKGALRFIGGRITKTRDAVVRTPTATIGVRGGLVIIEVGDDGTTSVVHIAGERTIVTGKRGGKVTLSRANASAEVSPDGDAKFTGLRESSSLAPILKAFEGTGTGGSPAGANREAIDAGAEAVAENNSEEEGGADREPVSTNGGRLVDDGRQDDTTVQNDPVIAKIVGGSETDDASTATETSTSTIPTAGSILTTTSGFQGFTAVSSGSLIGTTNSGDVLLLTVPESAADFDTTLFGDPAPQFAAQTLYPNTGLSEISFGEGSSFSGFTNIAGFGFSDLDIGFHVYIVEEGPGGAGEAAVALFGTPTPGQTVMHPDDDGTLAATVNTATTYIVEPDLELGTDSGGERVLVVANGGEGRFVPGSGGVAATGGKVLTANARVSVDPFTSVQSSELSVFGNTIGVRNDAPHLAGEVFGTEVSGNSRLISTFNISTLGDADQNSVYGPNGEYMFITSPFVNTGSGFDFETGEEHSLGGALAGFVAEPSEALAVLTLDPAGTSVVNDPLPLAQHAGSRASGSAGQENALMDGIHAAGIALCSDAQCGQDIAGVRTGFYSVRTGTFLSNGGDIAFENVGSVSDTNEVAFRFGLETSATELNVAAGGNTLQFSLDPLSNQRTAYFTDSLFAGNDEAAGNVGGQVLNADVLIASSGLAGDGDIFVGQNPNNFATQPVNARWGWWSSSFDVTSALTGNPTREDLIHMGAWVAGVSPDPANIPSTGVAAYGGVAIGTEADLATSVTQVVGGDFELSYDFGAAQGSFRMNISGLSINDVAIGDPANSHRYQINATSPVNFQADGSFFSSTTDPVAATGGDFQIDDTAGNRQITGVFVGDRQ